MDTFTQWALSALLVCALGVSQGALAVPDSINVNTAGAEQLAQALTGVGMARAQAIIEHREKFGPFVDLEDLQEVTGIGPSLIANNSDRIVFTE